MSELARFRAAAAAAAIALASCLAAAPAQALVVSIDGSGLVTPRAGFNPFASPWPLEGLPGFSVFTVGGEAGWTLASTFDVVVDFPLGLPDPGNGHGTFRLANAATGDVLEGTFDSVEDESNGPYGGYDLSWQVRSGLGRYLGYIGTGTTETVFTSDPRAQFPVSFTDTGSLVLRAIDEPGAAALAALALVAALARRRRGRAPAAGRASQRLALAARADS